MKIFRTAIALMALVCAVAGHCRDSIGIAYRASIIANASTGDFAPYMIGSWNSGRVVGANGIWHNGAATKALDLGKRFSWGAGVEYMLGYGSSATYERYADKTWTHSTNRQGPARIIQLYGEVKYRSVFLLVGQKERGSLIVDNKLSMGDVTRSNNAMPIPGVSAGFVDFQNIPFTNGWVQINGELMYGKFFDSKTVSNCYNRYNGVFPQHLYYHYKYCYFRTNPSQPFSVTAGAQEACLFGGSTEFYYRGIMTMYDKRGFRLKYLWNSFFPEHNNGEANAIGSSLGSWDLRARYRLRNGMELAGYFEWFWEDGSGLAKRNGWDGLWGVQLIFPRKGIVDNIVAEYLDFTNQAGPVHHWPSDWNGTDLNVAIGGADNYYNNDRYGPYANFGMAIGTPFVKSPIYNTDGDWNFSHCRTRGFHVGIGGQVMPSLLYTLRFSAQKAWGDGRTPAARALEDYSAGLDMRWRPALRRLPGLELNLNVAFDAGKLRGNNFGTMLTVSYDGLLSL